MCLFGMFYFSILFCKYVLGGLCRNFLRTYVGCVGGICRWNVFYLELSISYLLFGNFYLPFIDLDYLFALSIWIMYVFHFHVGFPELFSICIFDLDVPCEMMWELMWEFLWDLLCYANICWI